MGDVSSKESLNIVFIVIFAFLASLAIYLIATGTMGDFMTIVS